MQSFLIRNVFWIKKTILEVNKHSLNNYIDSVIVFFLTVEYYTMYVQFHEKLSRVSRD